MTMRLLCAVLLLLAWPAAAQPRWVTSWATAPMAMTGDTALPAVGSGSVTIRQSLRLSLAGTQLRVRLTNRYGSAPLHVEALRIGRAAATGDFRAIAGTERDVTFGAEAAITIPAGADFWSDPVALPVGPRDRLSVTLRVVPDGIATGHPGARTTTQVQGGGEPQQVSRWFYLAAVDVAGTAGSTIAVLGDSITDGYGVKDNSDGRWTDYLAERLQASPATRHLGVANLGIGGNRLLLDGLGPNALARLDRDVLQLSGVRQLVVLIGVNDLGTLTREAPVSPEQHRALVQRMIAGYRQIVARGREAGVRVIGATILPYGGSGYYHPDAANEADRQAINRWLRTPGNVDALIDFDAATRDPARPDRLRAEVDGGDGLHPGDAGYRAMAEAVPLELFAPAGVAVALTFDDLPEHGPLPQGVTASAVARDIAATLRRHRVAEAYGFANPERAGAGSAAAEPLTIWRRGGHPLANHGWSHANLDEIGVTRFADEVARAEPALRAAMPQGGWQWFRYPFLAEGRDAAVRAAAQAALVGRGYRVAPVSLDFSDWRFNQAYARCRGRGDDRAVQGLETRFLQAARESLATARARARERYGREVPLVALLHAGAFTARMLDPLLRLYESEGVRFARLSDAVADPAYPPMSAAPSDPIGAAAPDTSDVDRVCAAA